MKKLLLLAISLCTFCAAVCAQKGSPLVDNPGNGGNKKAASYSKKPLYKPSVFSDAPMGYPNKLISQPFSQQQYDYQRRLHFGFILAVSALDYKIISSSTPTYSSKSSTPHNFFVDVTNLSPALGVAALMDYRMNHNLSLRLQIGPTFGTRTLNFFEADTLSCGMQLESVLLEMPILIKYKALRHSNIRPYMIAGITPSCDAAAFKSFNENRGIYVAVKPFDVAATIGIGFDAYFEFFKFGMELKYVAGLFNTISSETLDGLEQYPNAIDKMYSRSFVLSLIFE